ncbi:hypothetical protein [Streptomyces sp. NPDC059009]|uniref:hypothetical protein n=1 Tax=Streptomyces sp. NPDC059009 TaxID=3346694 RepID=UPI0036C3FDB3
MSTTEWNIPEEALARSIFAPLGGLIQIGAVAATGTWSLADASVSAFVSARQSELDRLLELIQESGDFTAPALQILNDLGYLREHPVEAPYLLMWSSGYQDISSRLGPSQLDAPATVRRMTRLGADLQLADFLHALVTASIARGPDVTRGTRLIAEALGIGTRLVSETTDDAPATAPRTAFRTWRVAHLAPLLLPDSPAVPDARRLFREYAHALEELLAA